MELGCDLSAIQNEDLLRRMWQQTEDIDHKNEIRSHLYNLRESRLRDLYQGDIMSGNFAKDPLNPSHGDSLVGQNFQSLKSKEVRDSVGPASDLKFHSMSLNHPNTTGWDVQTSSEVSPDGRAYRTETLATTDGVEKINGGTAEFRGRNEQRASASHQGDDKNFVKKASESSNTQLQEHVVIGDENSGRSEVKMSSTTTSSSSHVTSSSSTVECGAGEPIADNSNRQHADQQHQQRLTQEQYIQQQQQRQQQLQQQEIEQTKQYQQHVQQQQQEQRQAFEEFNRSRQETSTSRNVETQQKTEQNRRIVDVEKSSPEYQQHVQHLMAQPGEIISNTVEYPKPNVKMITTVKRLPDGTIVKNKRYETEELQPTVENKRQQTTSQSSTQHRNEQQRRVQTEDTRSAQNRQQNIRNNTHSTNTPKGPENDVVDSAQPFARAPNQQHLVESHPTERFTDEATNVETKFSSVKKSSRRFSTETTSETIEELSDQTPDIRGKPQAPDFSTHGFPSVRSNKPTQEYLNDRPRPSDVEHLSQQHIRELHRPTPDVPHGFPAVRPNSNITTTKDGDVIVVSSESTSSSKYKTNAERVIETEVVIDGDSSDRPQKLTQPDSTSRDSPRYGTPTREYPSGPRKPQSAEDFSTQGFPSARSPSAPKPHTGYPVPSSTFTQDGNLTVVSSETKKTIKHNTNKEHVIETEILGENDRYAPSGIRQPDKITFPPTPQPADFSTHGFPSVKESVPTNDVYHRQGTPTRDYPGSPHKPQPSEDFSTHGFPSVRDTAPVRGSTPSRDYPSSPRQHHQQPTESFSTHGFPSVRTPSKAVPDYSTSSGGFPSARDTNAPRVTPTQSRPQPNTMPPSQKSTTTTDSSQRLISKERDVDASHRAFAASLRCSSPVDSTDHHRSTPRSSVSSTRTFRRDGREGSHDSETSRISSGTVTRSSPSKSVGKTVVTKQTVVKTRNVNGSNETIDLTPQRHTKSPSPNKTITTTTTRTTTTRKSPGEVPKPDNQKPKPAENTFPIINEPLTITKTHFTANDASILGNEVVEKPCLKKHFYKLGPSDRATNNVDEKSPYSPAPSNHLNRTHPKSKSQVRDGLADANPEELIHNKPLSSSVIEPKQRNRSPSGPKSSGPQTICQPFKKEPSVERRTVVRESTFENTNWQNTIQDINEKPYPVKGDFPKSPEDQRTPDNERNDEYIKTTNTKGSPVDTSDHPRKQPSSKKNTELVTKTTTRIEKLENNDIIDDTEECVETELANHIFVTKKTLDSRDKTPKEGKPNEPSSRNVNERHPAQPGRKAPAEKKPNNNDTSPTRRASDAKTSKIFSNSTILKTTRNINTYDTEDNSKPKNIVVDIPNDNRQTINKRPTNEISADKMKPIDGRPSEIEFDKGDNSPTKTSSDTRKLKTSTITTSTTKTRKNFVSPTRKSADIITSVPLHKKPTNKKPTELFGTQPSEVKQKKPIDFDNAKSSPQCIKAIPKSVDQPEQSDDDFNPVDRKSAESSEDETLSIINTTIKTVRLDEPELTHQTISDETRRVQQLINKTDKTKIAKNINEEFITFERQVDDSGALINRAVDEPRGTKTIESKPSEPLTNANIKKPRTETVSTKTKTYKETKNIDIEERNPNKIAGKQPISQPQAHNTNPNDIEQQTSTDTNISNISSVTTTFNVFNHGQRKSPEESAKPLKPKDGFETSVRTCSQPKDKKPKVLQLTDEDFSEEDETTRTTFEKTTTIKDIQLATENERKPGIGGPNVKKLSKPDSEKATPLKPVTGENDTTSATITTKTTGIITGKIHPENINQPYATSDEPNGKTTTVDESKRVEELFRTTNKTKSNRNHTEEFINIERQTKESPDGALISKAPEPEPSSPSYRKKGVSPRETFEDRCRQILGMENYGDTPGSYKRKPDGSPDETEQTPENITKFEVKIEDCEDDEPNYLNNIKSAIKSADNPKMETPDDVSDEWNVEEVECVRKETVIPFRKKSPERLPQNKSTRKSTLVVEEDITTKDNELIGNKITTKVIKKTTGAQLPKAEILEDGEEHSSSEPESLEKETDEESQPDTVISERETQYIDEFKIEEHIGKKQSLKPQKKSPTISPTRKAFEPTTNGKRSPTKQYPSTVTTTKNVEFTPKKREPKSAETKIVSDTKPIYKSSASTEKQYVVKKDKPTSPTKARTEPIQKIHTPKASDQPQKPNKEPLSSTIKDRLRSATRNKKPSTTETDSSPDLSPTRFIEQRRSSNISVHTEITIDHSGPQSPKPTERTPEKHSPQQKKPVPTEYVSPTKPFRRFPVTERKESAPVPSVARKEKDVKMTRSTSEKIIKVTEKPVKKPDVSSLAPSPIPKADRRPNKCFTTKTINLTTTEKLINSGDMENVIIDIQHAKSSREPSPDKIVPTPVSVHLDTGKPRYPDVVQEPEDEPRKKPVIKNIPIFEEESNEFINCHISEVKTEKISKLVDLEEDDILDNPTIEAPQSLEYTSIDRPDDDCLLSVHEKVSKFTHTAEEITKPKASSPFSREFDKTPKVPENDECLLTVDEKVSKFIKTAEEITKPITPVREIERPSLTDLNEELQKDDCTMSVSQKVNKFLSTAEKLAPTAPQRSPELVAKIVRTISKQSEPEYPDDISDDELTPFSQNHTIEIEKRRQKDILSRPNVFESTTTTNGNDVYVEEEVTVVRSAPSEPESDEVIPHTKDHTTKIELKRQKNILSRPSIYDKGAKPRLHSPTKTESLVLQKPHQSISTKTNQTEYTTKKITNVDNERTETKEERKPSTTTSKCEINKTPTKLQTSTVAVTRSRFEISDKKKSTPKPSTEPKSSRVPLSSYRKPSNEPKTQVPSTSARSGSNTPHINRSKPFNEPDNHSPQSPVATRKQSTERDSHFPARKSSKESITNVYDNETIESEPEFISTTRRRSSSKTKDYLETVQTEIERFSPTQKEPVRKIPLQENQKPKSSSRSPIRKDSTLNTTKVTKVTERTIQHNSPSECSDIEIVETIIERPSQVKSPTPTSTVGRTRITPDTVAARRNIFESSPTPKAQKPSGSSSPSPIGRRPSYMDHTVSSLEHIRRDSLEVNKNNYSRKSSVESEINYERRPNTAVKFDVPQKPQRTSSVAEDIDVESIFELEVLERLLETVTSYELRRRIRAQIRLIKKNILNAEVVDKRKSETKTSKSISSTHKTSTYTSNVHNEETDTTNEDLKTKRPYESKSSPKPTTPPTKSVRVTEIEDLSKKSSYYRSVSPKRYGEENTKKITTNGRSQSPKRPPKTPQERHHSPESKSPQGSVKGARQTTGSSKSTRQEYIRSEQSDYSEETFNSSSRIDQSSERFERDQIRERSCSPESRSPVRNNRQSPDLKAKYAPSTRTKSPDASKRKHQPSISPQGRTPKQRDNLYITSKVTTVKTTRSPERKPSKPADDENAPIWADRKNLLKSPSSTRHKVPASPSTRTTSTKITTSTKSTNQRQTQNKNFEEDSITSSYGIGPTDENGLPLFGIKALKKKKPSQPCEATEEVTGYVIEEKYYSDNKTKPKVERKEYIYSTNADELEEIKKTVEKSRKSPQDDVDVIRKVEKIDKNFVFEKPDAIMPDSEEFTTSSQYVRRGSVKELSEKFIRKESSQSITEKSGGYPKAGLILRTSRGPSADPSGDSYETTTEKYTTTSRSGQSYRSLEDDTDDEQNVQLRQTQARRIFTESDDNETDQCHLSTRSSAKSTRSFLNSSAETKVVTSVDDALERMRNADYVVEAGDTAEDQEARSLLNKFLGASVIMRGVESVLPTSKQTTTTTITKTSYADDDGASDLLNNKAVKTTRITKTTKSGSSSTPVTRTTCDIEEIWDEEILKQLLEQATTYEERRKIRARLRDLMAEREEKKDLNSGEVSENAPEIDESSASEYEEIIEEVTVSDYSDAEAGLGEEEELNLSQNKALENNVENKEKEIKIVKKESTTSEVKNEKELKAKELNNKEETKAESNANVSDAKSVEKAQVETAAKETALSNTKAKPSNDKTISSTVIEGESLVPLLQGILQNSLPKVNANSQKTKAKAPNTELNQAAETSTQTNKACSNSSSSERSDLCTVNNCNNNCNKNHTDHTNTKNKFSTQIDSNNIQTNSDSNVCTNTNKSLVTKESQSTMTRDIVMLKSTAESSGSGNCSGVSVSKQKQLDRLGVPQKEDSGTESGEDLRLIAAGLRDSLQLQSDTNLIEEVTAALTRLELSLKEGKDIPVDGSKREALLALVARLQTGLSSPDAAVSLSNMGNNGGPYDETSSPEADAHHSNRQRFARRRNRNSRHTVGVSREELADARRYMEDMQLIENISNCTTPESATKPVTPPQWYPIEKNPSSGAILSSTAASTLYRPNQFVPAQLKVTSAYSNSENKICEKETDNTKNKRPLSGNFSVSFQSNTDTRDEQAKTHAQAEETSESHMNGNVSPDSSFKSNRFSNKKQIMKRANTIDIPKSKKYNPDFDTDSEPEDNNPQLGLKRTLQVNVKHKVRSVIPPFVPKTENDHKFLAFINKQSAKPGLGWTGSRSVSNWTSKFGNLKHTFEVGAAAQVTTGKPPQAPGHVPHSAAKNYWQKQVATHDYHQQQQQYLQYQQQQQQQEQMQRNQHDKHERQRRVERERQERERIERDRLERQRLERQRQERDRIEREYYEREIMERERLAAAQHAAMPSMTVPKPVPVNKFQHAPQSVFRPIDNNDTLGYNILKPIPQIPQKLNTWQPPSISNKPLSAPAQLSPASPQFLTTKQSVNGIRVTSPSSSASSPIGLPWVAKPAVDNSDFRKKAYTFEERSQNDNRQNSILQRHHSLRSPKASIQPMDEYKKRPSLPSTADPYMAAQRQYVPQQTQIYASTSNIYGQQPPQPTNISFTYADLARTNNFKSYPCLPSAVETSITADYVRQRKSSLTDPSATPLILTSSNPTYEPPAGAGTCYNDVPALKQFDYASPMDSAPASPSLLTMPPIDFTDDDDLDSENLMEYHAETRVMGKPQTQTAVTVRDRRTAHASDDEVFGKNSRNAKNLLHTMRNIGKNGNGGVKVKKESARKVESPNICLSPDGRPYQAPIVEPLFPQLSKFEPNRVPEYTGNTNKNRAEISHKKTRAKTPPKPNLQMDRSLQLARAEDNYRLEQQKYVENSKYASLSKTANEQQPVQYQMGSISNGSLPNTVPYVSETQTAYVVTYPTEDIFENGYVKPHPTSLALQRNRNLSENSSTSSTISHNLASPGTSWTPNPIHTVNEVIPQQKAVNMNSLQLKTYQTQAETQSQPQPQPQSQNYSNAHNAPPSKPNVAHKPSVLTSAPNTPSAQTQPTYQQIYAPPQNSKLQAQPQPQTKLPRVERPQQQVRAAPKLSTRSQTITSTWQSQSFEQPHQSQQTTNPAPRASDAAITPIQAQKRVLSQQSLVSIKQRQLEKHDQEQQQLAEIRRKSLGNVFDVQQQQRKVAYISDTKTIIKQEYKSSAPADTPDIVKSSLPKEDMPILKKFGPPQRHHYIPNSYQSPVANTQTQKFESSTKVIKSSQHEIIQHSTLTKKPSIVETPATPQPDEDLIPRNIVFNNISAFTSMSRRQEQNQQTQIETQPRMNRLSKSDSWNQIVQIRNKTNVQLPPTSPKFGNSAGSGSELRRTKSGHTLNVRMYEAGIDKSQVGEKQRTVEAYFSGKSPNQLDGETVEMRTAVTTATTSTTAGTKKSTINRHKTSEKISASRKSLSNMSTSNGTSAGTTVLGGGLIRSATMPHIANVNLLDESNVDDAFEQLIMGA